MLISAMRVRKEFVLRSFCRSSVSLCCTRGWSITVTFDEVMRSSEKSKYGSVADNAQRRVARFSPAERARRVESRESIDAARAEVTKSAVVRADTRAKTTLAAAPAGGGGGGPFRVFRASP